uniref:Uncharacterized protein n=1 Tax=Cucumis melo TaxID=3656 RepID=A0A9I9EIS0_CUCME
MVEKKPPPEPKKAKNTEVFVYFDRHLISDDLFQILDLTLFIELDQDYGALEFWILESTLKPTESAKRRSKGGNERRSDRASAHYALSSSFEVLGLALRAKTFFS